MDEPLAITGPIDVHAFRAGIFTPFNNVLSPVEFQLNNVEEFQPLVEALDGSRYQLHLQEWVDVAVIAGVAQYTARTGKKMGLLGLPITTFRNAITREISADVEHFGVEQCLWPQDMVTKQAIADNPLYSPGGLYGDEKLVYVGPPRLAKTVVISRLFPINGNSFAKLPEAVASVNSVATVDPASTQQAYHLFLSMGGALDLLTFGPDQCWDPREMTRFGRLSVDDRVMQFRAAKDYIQPKESFLVPKDHQVRGDLYVSRVE